MATLAPDIAEAISAPDNARGIRVELSFHRAGTTDLFVYDGAGTVIDAQRLQVREPAGLRLIPWDDLTMAESAPTPGSAWRCRHRLLRRTLRGDRHPRTSGGGYEPPRAVWALRLSERPWLLVGSIGAGIPRASEAEMMVALLAAVAVGAPAGFKVTKTTESCTVYAGAPIPSGQIPMLAECRWPNLTLEKIDPVFSRLQDHDLFFSAVSASDIERTEGGVTYVRQVHQARGISDRECVLKMRRTLVDGGVKFDWTLDTAPLTLAEGRVAVAHDVGYWLFTPHPDGGVSVSHYLEYDPGGSVPCFLGRSFQGSGFEASVTELRAYLESH